MKSIYKDYCKLKYNGEIELTSHSIECGFCGNKVAPNTGYYLNSGYEDIYIYKCPQCSNPIIYNSNSEETFPGAMYGREVKGLPENIQTLYDECRTNYSNKCYTSSQMIARTLLMHIAVEQGAKEGETFAKYIDYLDNNHYIPPNGKDWVDFIRKSGNVANHEIIIKEKEETEKVITFLSSLLLFIYELPNEMSGDEKS
ncbi:DUF4145 domain-containing protein [Ruminococcus sp.]|uniref:DUF4145 domain-containing protein n=1 Tax=Ruminococcus sp. TaxID=41978 RepID=UPI0025CE614E|nr:DUF4145 domain-containing protein [Ruminococcus sp.]